MNTVYAVSAGAYSDYHVLAIFATEKQAKSFIEQYDKQWSDNPFVEEFAFVPKGKEIKKRRYYVVRLKDGEVDQRGIEQSLKPLRSNAWRYERDRTWAYGYSTRSYAVAEQTARDALTKLELEQAGL